MESVCEKTYVNSVHSSDTSEHVFNEISVEECLNCPDTKTPSSKNVGFVDKFQTFEQTIPSGVNRRTKLPTKEKPLHLLGELVKNVHGGHPTMEPGKNTHRSLTTSKEWKELFHADTFTFDTIVSDHTQMSTSRSSSAPRSLSRDSSVSSPLRVPLATFERLHNAHTVVSEQKRKESPSPRSRSGAFNYDCIKEDSRTNLDQTASMPPRVSLATFERLHNTHTVVSDRKRKESPSPRSRSGAFNYDRILDQSTSMPLSRVSLATCERLHNTHTVVSDHKRKESPSPRSRYGKPFYCGVSGEFRKYLNKSPMNLDGSPSKRQQPKAGSNTGKNSNVPTSARSTSVPTSLSSAFDRLHVSPTKVSKAKEEYRKQCREKIAEKVKKREMERNGECRIDYGSIAPSRASDMYYLGMAVLARKEIEIAKHSKNFQTKLNVDKIVMYSNILKRKEQDRKRDH
jgi:hypothetical protein